MTPITFGSVCSGIEAASVAFNPLGWHAAWFSEIDPFCNALLRHHYPDVPNWTDMTLLRHMIRAGLVAAPDVLCGGTPCQAFSVAGLRESLNDARGNLTLEFVKVADAIDQQRNEPCVVLWENVPGVLTTGDNAFGAFLGGLAGADSDLSPPDPLPAAGKSSRRWKWKGGRHVAAWPDAGLVVGPARTVAWRVLDAQYFGLAQRRRRVFVVASARKGFDPGSVLFEWEGVRRDTAPSRQARQDTAGGAGHGTAFGGNNTSGPIDLAAALNASASASASGRLDFESETFVAHTLRAEGFDASEDGTGRGTPLVATGVDYRNASLSGDICGTIEAAQSKGNRGQDALAAGPGAGVVAFHWNAQASQLPGADRDTGVTPSLTCSQGAAVAYSTKLHNTQSNGAGKLYLEYTASLDRSSPPPALLTAAAVRRLTPRECEALQGFPTDYTLVPGRTADGPRYKALGNSWAVPVVRWIGQRIASAINTAKMLP